MGEIELYTYHAWVRVMGLKEKIRSASIAGQLARKAGEVLSIDERSVKGQGGGVRDRVFLYTRKPLTRCASLTLRENFYFILNMMPVFCGSCGTSSHVAKEHVHAADAVIYLDTLIAANFRREEPPFFQGAWSSGGRTPIGRGMDEGKMWCIA